MEQFAKPDTTRQRPLREPVNPRLMGFTGNLCSTCGSPQMVRNGTCEKCLNCGSTTGCS